MADIALQAMRHFLASAAVGALALGLTVTGCSSSANYSDNSPSEEEVRQSNIRSARRVNFQEMSNEYVRNPIRFKANYLGKYYRYTGTVRNISEGPYSLVLNHDSVFNPARNEWSKGASILCEISSDDEPRIISLNAGDTVSVVGLVESFNTTNLTSFFSRYLAFMDCSLQ